MIGQTVTRTLPRCRASLKVVLLGEKRKLSKRERDTWRLSRQGLTRNNIIFTFASPLLFSTLYTHLDTSAPPDTSGESSRLDSDWRKPVHVVSLSFDIPITAKMARFSREKSRPAPRSVSPWMTAFYICAILLAPMLFMGMIPTASAQDSDASKEVTGPGMYTTP